MDRNSKLLSIYHTMHSALGNSDWWPGETSLEIMLGAILTQNTSWINVEKAINNLKNENLLTLPKIQALEEEALAELIRPAGFFRIKAKRIRALLAWIEESCGSDLEKLSAISTEQLREELLEVKGIGPETADAILLYALNRPSFVVDEYTRRIFSRHALVWEDISYFELREFFMDVLEPDTALFNEYHALIVRVGKTWCKRSKPLCDTCPLKKFLDYQT